MSWGSALLWSFAATVVLTGLMAGSQGAHVTRMSIPYMLGTLFTYTILSGIAHESGRRVRPGSKPEIGQRRAEFGRVRPAVRHSI